MTTFTVINDETLVAAIDRCQSRLVWAAPGITAPVVDAIGRLFERNHAPDVTIIIDADPEVCRFGYGTVGGLIELRALVDRHHIGVRNQPGLRVGMLASDDDIWVYAPTPRLIEAGSMEQEKPNAVALGSMPLQQLLQATGAEGAVTTSLAGDSEIGKSAATPAHLDAALADLARLAPKSFNVARVERVFNSKLQYVEIELTGYKLSARRVTIPNDLLIGADSKLEMRLRNTFALLDGDSALTFEIDLLDLATYKPRRDEDGDVLKEKYSEARIEADRKNLQTDFLTNVKGYGWLIRRWDRPAFDSRVGLLRKKLEAYRDGVKKALAQTVQESIWELAESLLPNLQERFPPRLSKQLWSPNPSHEELLEILVMELRKAFGGIDHLIDPQLRVQFKDLSYETIQDQKFQDALNVAFPLQDGESAYSKLFEEHDAARESHRPKLMRSTFEG